MVRFPVHVQYTDESMPAWMAVLKENAENPFTLTITMEDWNKIRFDEDNIEALLVDLQSAILDAGLTVSDIYTFATFLRFTAPEITLILNGTGTDTIEIILPAGVTVRDVINAGTGLSVPFFYNRARNSVVITITFSSEVELKILVGAIISTLNSAVQSISGVIITASVLNIIFSELGKIIKEVREKV